MKLTILTLLLYTPLAIYAFTGAIYRTTQQCLDGCPGAVRTILYLNGFRKILTYVRI